VSKVNNRICSRHNIAEILLELALNTSQSINQSITQSFLSFIFFAILCLIFIFCNNFVTLASLSNILSKKNKNIVLIRQYIQLQVKMS